MEEDSGIAVERGDNDKKDTRGGIRAADGGGRRWQRRAEYERHDSVGQIARKSPGFQSSFRYRELEEATNEFRSLLGKGSSAPVFEGILTDGTSVAVKRIEGEEGREGIQIGSCRHSQRSSREPRSPPRLLLRPLRPSLPRLRLHPERLSRQMDLPSKQIPTDRRRQTPDGGSPPENRH
ncbi:non-specific serine,threonine protein kinase [Sarracenia purpurea var. burkii]